jgi:RNA polymerase sigma-70 factor (family 1)
VSINSIKDLNDAELLALIQQDERDAFKAIYNRYWSKLYISAYKILRDRYHSEDIVQEVLLKLWLKRSDNNIECLNAYLHNAVRFQVFNNIRNGKVRASLFVEIGELFVENDAENNLLSSDFNRKLEASIIELPQKCRKIFLLSRREQMSTKEIADRLDISPKTVENQLTIALRRLRTSFGRVLICLAAVIAVSLIN